MDVNIRDKRGEEAIVLFLGAIAAIVGGILLFGLIPGVLLTSALNYFIHFSPGQLWAFSIILSVAVFIGIKSRYKDWTISFKKYTILATVAGCLLGLSALLFKYNFPVRTVMRMFNTGKNIPFKHLTAPSETSEEILGTYAGEALNTTYNSKGEVSLYIIRVNYTTDSVDAGIQWSNGLNGSSELRGTLKGKILNLFTIPSHNNGNFETLITGEMAAGKVNCSYKIKYPDKDEIQEGKFSARNIKMNEE